MNVSDLLMQVFDACIFHVSLVELSAAVQCPVGVELSLWGKSHSDLLTHHVKAPAFKSLDIVKLHSSADIRSLCLHVKSSSLLCCTMIDDQFFGNANRGHCKICHTIMHYF